MTKSATARLVIALLVLCATLGMLSPLNDAAALQATTHGGVEFPQGDISFADRVVSFTPGPQAGDSCVDGTRALGVPDYTGANDCTTYVSLGNAESVCQSELVLEFVDNALIDVPGDDIYVFEIGPAVESTELFIGNAGQGWIEIGRIEGSTRGIDIAPFVNTREEFTLVRLCDFVDGTTSGAAAGGGPDIDAVGAIGAVPLEEGPNRGTETDDDDDDGAGFLPTFTPVGGSGTTGTATPSTGTGGTPTPVAAGTGASPTSVLGGTGQNPDIPGTTSPPPPFPAPQPANVDRMTLQAGQRQVVAGGFVWVPVYLLRSGNVANINYEIEYGANVAVIEGNPQAGNLLGNHLFQANANDSGLVRVGIAGTSGIVGSGTVTWLPFRAVGQPGDVTQLTVTISTINTPDGSVPTIDRIHGRVIITDQSGQVPGDCNGDATLTEFDAFCALEMSVGLRPVNLVLDMNADGQVTSRDATLILQRVLGLA